jgi:Putative lumazine-binding
VRNTQLALLRRQGHTINSEIIMNRSVVLSLSVFGAAALLAGAGGSTNPDEQAIRRHIERYYFEGVRHSDTAAAHKAFHPVAKMYFLRDGSFAERSIPDWLSAIAERAPNPPRPDGFPRRVVAVDVSGGAATAKLELRYADAVITDYMSLLKVNGEWTIVGKIFDRQPLSAQASGR